MAEERAAAPVVTGMLAIPMAGEVSGGERIRQTLEAAPVAG